MPKFGQKSLGKLNTVHADLRLIALTVIERSKVDFSIIEGARAFETQLHYFLEGKSKLDPRRTDHFKRAMHVTSEERPKAMAIDIGIYHQNYETRKDIIWDQVHLAYVAGLFDSVAAELYEDGKVEHLIRWGGNWDNDGIIMKDQRFQDLVHLELRKP